MIDYNTATGWKGTNHWQMRWFGTHCLSPRQLKSPSRVFETPTIFILYPHHHHPLPPPHIIPTLTTSIIHQGAGLWEQLVLEGRCSGGGWRWSCPFHWWSSSILFCCSFILYYYDDVMMRLMIFNKNDTLIWKTRWFARLCVQWNPRLGLRGGSAWHQLCSLYQRVTSLYFATLSSFPCHTCALSQARIQDCLRQVQRFPRARV